MQDKKPLISVIVPNYNHGYFLEQRLSSVLNQTYPNLELIILDDFSSDNSNEIIEKFRSNQRIVSVIYNSQNSGSTFKQWEKGISIANGKYIWIAESDDDASPYLLERVMQTFTKHSDVGIVKVASIWIDQDDKVILEENLTEILGPISGTEYAVENMSFKNSLYNASSIVFRKCLAEGIIDGNIKQMRYCGDWLFWNRLLLKTSI
ncbi:MAG: glycosyltransferase family 2 protein, partial [Flavobacterium sp.]